MSTPWTGSRTRWALGGSGRAARRSGAQLCDVLDRLSDEQAATLVPARIVDGGAVVLDAPVPWAGLMGAQEHRHVASHTEALRELRAVGPTCSACTA